MYREFFRDMGTGGTAYHLLDLDPECSGCGMGGLAMQAAPLAAEKASSPGTMTGETYEPDLGEARLQRLKLGSGLVDEGEGWIWLSSRSLQRRRSRRRRLCQAHSFLTQGVLRDSGSLAVIPPLLPVPYRGFRGPRARQRPAKQRRRGCKRHKSAADRHYGQATGSSN